MPNARQLVLWLLLCAVGCSADPAHLAWYDDFMALEREPMADAQRIVRLDELGRRAPGAGDRCTAAIAAARIAAALNEASGRERCQAVLAEAACHDEHAEALYCLFQLGLQDGDSPELPEGLMTRHTHTYWARQAFKLVWQHRSKGEEGALADHFLSWYDKLRESTLAGHCLYYAAQALAQVPGRVDEVTEVLTRLVADHSSSPLWDEAVVEAADLLEMQGQESQARELLLAAIDERADRGGEGDAFSARLHMRLAGGYRDLGDFEQALRHYREVVNTHDLTSLKDDALWRSADIYASLGEQDDERRTLEFLIEHCPWSRHLDAARARLARP